MRDWIPTLLTSESVFIRFFSKVEIGDPDACWIWVASTDGSGYGKFKGPFGTKRAHRLSYEFFHGPIPDGMVVRHRCPGGDNPLCVNPRHLYLGTQEDNIHDMMNDGSNPRCLKKFEDGDREAIIILAAQGIAHRVIADNYSVDRSTISRIIRRAA
jgi:hypothetical protein